MSFNLVYYFSKVEGERKGWVVVACFRIWIDILFIAVRSSRKLIDRVDGYDVCFIKYFWNFSRNRFQRITSTH